MRIVRDGAHFALFGAIQVALDSTVYIALTHADASPASANVCGRIVGAALGFWLNGHITFGHHAQPRLPLRVARYATLWLALTTLSTVALSAIARDAGLASSWWAKPLIETALGVTSFAISRHWVYRR